MDCLTFTIFIRFRHLGRFWNWTIKPLVVLIIHIDFEFCWLIPGLHGKLIKLQNENLRFSFVFIFQVVKHRKPKRITLHWVHYACGAVGLSLCSLWLLRHSSLMGSSDLDNWFQEAKDSTVSFFNDHVEQPVKFFFIILLDFIRFFFFPCSMRAQCLAKWRGCEPNYILYKIGGVTSGYQYHCSIFSISQCL